MRYRLRSYPRVVVDAYQWPDENADDELDPAPQWVIDAILDGTLEETDRGVVLKPYNISVVVGDWIMKLDRRILLCVNATMETFYEPHP